jgi:hypothetical protein
MDFNFAGNIEKDITLGYGDFVLVGSDKLYVLASKSLCQNTESDFMLVNVRTGGIWESEGTTKAKILRDIKDGKFKHFPKDKFIMTIHKKSN